MEKPFLVQKLYKTSHRPDLAMCSSMPDPSIDVQINENKTMNISNGFEIVMIIRGK